MPTHHDKTPPDLRLYYTVRPPPRFADPDPVRIQTYFPSMETLFPTIVDQPDCKHPQLASSELALDISGGVALVENLVTKTQRTCPVWIRKAHLVEPVSVMADEYILPDDGSLPASRERWQRTLYKINDPYNEAYTDAVFACMASRLVETGRSPHWCRFYGTYTGRTSEYQYKITQDMPDIEGEPWFRKGLQTGAFQVMVVDPYNPGVSAPLERPWENIQKKLAEVANCEEESVIDVDDGSISQLEKESDSRTETKEGDHSDADSAASSVEDDAESEADIDTNQEDDTKTADTAAPEDDFQEVTDAADTIETNGTVNLNRLRLQLNRITGSAGTHSSEQTEEDDLEFLAILKNFPVQFTVLERCDGTMDDLMEDEISETASADMQNTMEERWTAWVFQIIAALTTAQQLYDFVHNDLHTNNIMWCGTDQTHLYYHITGAPGGDRYYRVPTYGRIFKIIDFGRATFRPPPAPGKPHQLWMPDAYAPDADATDQYNCGPYMDKSKPKVQPNKSFDLSRLAVAMLETLWDATPPAPVEPRRVLTREPGRTQPETVSPLWNLLWLWLTDKHGKNILRTPDGLERYVGFEIYCAIARDIQNAVPAQQLTLPLFDNTFRCRRKDIPDDVTIWKVQGQPAAVTESSSKQRRK